MPDNITKLLCRNRRGATK